jgi:Nuclease-related domain
MVAAGFWWWKLIQRRRRDIDRRLREACRGVLANFVIPDGNGEEIQVQYALLTARGILIIDIKDVEGHVFGSEAMQDWTVIADDRRFTFANPQPGLWDRVAAVKRLTPEVPVIGFVGFTGRARFTKGQPRSVTLLEPLLQELEKEAAGARQAGEGYLAAWDRLRQAAMAARMDHMLSAGPR